MRFVGLRGWCKVLTLTFIGFSGITADQASGGIIECIARGSRVGLATVVSVDAPAQPGGQPGLITLEISEAFCAFHAGEKIQLYFWQGQDRKDNRTPGEADILVAVRRTPSGRPEELIYATHIPGEQHAAVVSEVRDLCSLACEGTAALNQDRIAEWFRAALKTTSSQLIRDEAVDEIASPRDEVGLGVVRYFCSHHPEELDALMKRLSPGRRLDFLATLASVCRRNITDDLVALLALLDEPVMHPGVEIPDSSFSDFLAKCRSFDPRTIDREKLYAYVSENPVNRFRSLELLAQLGDVRSADIAMRRFALLKSEGETLGLFKRLNNSEAVTAALKRRRKAAKDSADQLTLSHLETKFSRDMAEKGEKLARMIREQREMIQSLRSLPPGSVGTTELPTQSSPSHQTPGTGQ